MPTHSIAAARAWRETHLHPGRAKPAPRAPSLSALLEEAEALLDVGGDIGPLLPDLRLALHQIPGYQRAAVGMSEALWDVLTDPVGSAFELETPNPSPRRKLRAWEHFGFRSPLAKSSRLDHRRFSPMNAFDSLAFWL